MAIVSDKDHCFGKPRMDGTRLWLGWVVETLQCMDLDALLTEWDYLTREQIREALDYCRKERCIGNVVKYCCRCTKDDSPPIKDDPSRGIHVLGDVSLTQALAEWNPANRVLCLGTEEELNRKDDLWLKAEQLYHRYFGEENA